MVSALNCSLLGTLAVATASMLVADKTAIVIDGRFEDWEAVPIAATDPTDAAPDTVDFKRLWIAEDDTYLFIRVETGIVVDPSENNNLVLFLEGGAGRVLEWQLGNRQGTFRVNGSVADNNIRYTDIGFHCMPTLDTKDLEMAIRLDARPDGITELFSGTAFKIRLEDTEGGDRIPDTGDGTNYVAGSGDLPEEIFMDFRKERTTDLRLATYNIRNDNLFDSSLHPGFRRQLQAIQPDIIHFQEIRSNSADNTRALIESWLPLPDGQTWSAVGGSAKGKSNVTVSRFPILGDWGVYTPFQGENQTTLIDTSSQLGTQTLVINAHLPSGDNDSARQGQVDSIMTYIRDLKRQDRPRHILTNTPIIIAGDMNFVGRTRQLDSFLSGDIVNNNLYGIDSVPDWDNTNLTSITPRHSDQRMGYTWRSDLENNYWPGHLDYIIYTDSVFDSVKNFVVHTPSMSSERLEAYGLQSEDSLVSDHLIFVADFRPAFWDTDENGLPDFWEKVFFGDIGTTHAKTDTDFDGLNNLQEYHFGTDPKDRTSLFEVSGLSYEKEKTTIQWSTVVDRIYQLQMSIDLKNWSGVSEVIRGTGHPVTQVISTPVRESTFFRILVN